MKYLFYFFSFFFFIPCNAQGIKIETSGHAQLVFVGGDFQNIQRMFSPKLTTAFSKGKEKVIFELRATTSPWPQIQEFSIKKNGVKMGKFLRAPLFLFESPRNVESVKFPKSISFNPYGWGVQTGKGGLKGAGLLDVTIHTSKKIAASGSLRWKHSEKTTTGATVDASYSKGKHSTFFMALTGVTKLNKKTKANGILYISEKGRGVILGTSYLIHPRVSFHGRVEGNTKSKPSSNLSLGLLVKLAEEIDLTTDYQGQEKSLALRMRVKL